MDGPYKIPIHFAFCTAIGENKKYDRKGPSFWIHHL